MVITEVSELLSFIDHEQQIERRRSSGKRSRSSFTAESQNLLAERDPEGSQMPSTAERSMRIKRHSETLIQPRVWLCQETKTIKLVIFDLEKHEKIVEIPIVDCHEGDVRKMKM